MSDMAEVVCMLDSEADPVIVMGPLMIESSGGDPTNEPEREALARSPALLGATVTDDLCADA